MGNKMIRLGGQEFDSDTVVKMAQAGLLTTAAGNVVTKNDPASTTPTRNVLQGGVQDGSGNYNGTFSYPGVRPDRFSALPRPPSFLGLASLTRSEYQNERLEILTGQTADGTVNAAGFCANPPSAGNLKTCQQLFTFGDFYAKTELNAAALTGSLRDRAEIPGRILNARPADFPLLPDIMWNLADTRSPLQGELYRFGNAFQRSTTQVGISGVAGVKNNTYWGWFTQFAGLDSQIKTGYADVVSGVACPAADSWVRTYGANVSGNSVNGANVVQEVQWMLQTLKTRGMQVGMDGVEYAIVMRPELWDIFIEYYTCGYYIYACAGDTSSPNFRDATAQRTLLDEMRRDRYLLIDGDRIQVILDEGIPRETIGNQFYNSDVYFVPISWNGMPLLRLEYFAMDNQYINEFFNAFGFQTVTSINNGMFLVGHRNTGLCLEWHFQARMRLILETPFLAGRLDNVQYTTTRGFRDSFPGASNYVNGGQSLRIFN